MNSIEKLLKIEKKYNLYKLKSWKYLRVYYSLYIEKVLYNCKDIEYKQPFLSNFLNKLKSATCGVSNLFRSYQYIIFDLSDDYKVIDGLSVNRLTEIISNNLGKKNILHIQTGNNKNIKSKDLIVNDTFISVLTKLCSIFVRSKEIHEYKILNEEYGINFNSKSIFNILRIRQKIIKIILTIYKPKVVFITCYTKRSEVLAAKELNIPVVEIQHGIVNIPAYQGVSFDPNSQPDYILTFGFNDKKIIEKTNYIQKKEHIVPVGSYLLDKFLSNNNDTFLKFRNKFKTIVSISLQDDILKETLGLVNTSASTNKNILFVLIQRNKKVNISEFEENVIILNDFTCLEIVSNSDFHLTVFSTCAYESASLGIPNIFWNYNNLSNEYFYRYIQDKNYNFIVETVEELNNLLDRDIKLDKKAIMYQNKDYYINNYSYNIENFLIKLRKEINDDNNN